MSELIKKIEDEVLKYIESLESVEEGGAAAEYEPVGYEPSENEMKIVDELNNANLPQLGIHLIFVGSAILGRQSGMVVAPRGKGKTKVLTLAHFKSGLAVNPRAYDRITDAAQLNELNNTKTEVMIEDFSNVVNEKELLTCYSTLVTQGRYEIPGKIKIENADTTFWFGIQPVLLKQLVGMDIWKSMVVDRFPRYYMFYYKRPAPKRWLEENEFPELEKLDVYDGEPEMKVDESKIEVIAKVLTGQLSFERALGFVKKMLRGHAKLCNRSEVTDDDLKWLSLYVPTMMVERIFVKEIRETTFDESLYNGIFEYFLNMPEDVSNMKTMLRVFFEQLGCKCYFLGKKVRIEGFWWHRFRELFDTFSGE
jgi:hypothetical protein